MKLSELEMPKRSSRKLPFIVSTVLMISLLLANTWMVLAEEDYMGAQWCEACHSEEYDSWVETDHANAAGIEESNSSGTWYYVAAKAHRIYTEEDFLASCRDCHVTGWDEETESWPEMDTDPGKFLGIQCEYCHGPGMTMQVDYAAAVCADCHNQPGDHELSGHSQSWEDLQTSSHMGDSCTHCMTTQGFIDETVTLETEGLVSLSCAACHDVHSAENHYQLRYETADELCAMCHVGSHNPQSEMYPEGPHDRADVECVDCHGQGVRLWHGSEDEWFNHTFGIYNTYTPYNQTEPMVCSACHELEWATEQLEVIELLSEGFAENATEVVESALSAIETVSGLSGVSEADITEATELAEEAESIIDYVVADASGGLHNPEKTYAMLSYASQLANEAMTSALEAESSALSSDVSSLESDVSSLESEKSDLQDQVTGLQSEVSTLETEVSDLEASSGSGTMNLAIGGIVGVIIGAVAVYFITKK